MNRDADGTVNGTTEYIGNYDDYLREKERLSRPETQEDTHGGMTRSAQDREKAFKTLDSLRTEILNGAVSFKMAANFYSEDLPTKTNGGQMADPNTGSAYFEIDQLKPEDYRAIKDLKEGEISQPVESTDNEGRQDQEKDFVVGKTNYKIIRVDKIIPAHTASFNDDFSQLQDEVRRSKQMAALDEFMDNKIAQTRVIIDPMFKDCEFHRKGWASKFSED